MWPPLLAANSEDDDGTHPAPSARRLPRHRHIPLGALYDLIASGKITTRKLGRKTLIPREDLVRFAAQLARGRPEAA